MANAEDPSLKISKKLHEKICSMIMSPEGKKNFKSAEAVIEFLFDRYDERIKDKISSMNNKGESKKPFSKIREQFENSLSKEEARIYFNRELDRISEITKHLNSSVL